jgi:hypothetical protein
MSATYMRLQPDKELEFSRPLSQGVIKQILKISNPHSKTGMAFKVKTTAPKQYCVRPNNGVVKPGETLEVHVLLQPFKEEPAADFKCKDKFLVQAIPVTDSLLYTSIEDQNNQLLELWSKEEQKKKEGNDSIIEEMKLKVNFMEGSSILPIINDMGKGLDSQKELKDAKETIKKLQQVCDGYKNEIERLNVLRQKKEIPTSSNASSSISLKKQNGISLLILIIAMLVAFFGGVLFF